jgi:hypothetical protein
MDSSPRQEDTAVLIVNRDQVVAIDGAVAKLRGGLALEPNEPISCRDVRLH